MRRCRRSTPRRKRARCAGRWMWIRPICTERSSASGAGRAAADRQRMSIRNENFDKVPRRAAARGW
ncbi:hypothetical protein [Lysobacter gummosus]|uniref:hypothetical protein n=1 Tax=Lysobacter gummosus TaxID=262324 RepID=UPI00362CDFDD